MTDPEILVKATLNRLRARLEQKINKSAEELAEIAKEGPDLLKKEWNLFTEEIIEESDRLKRENPAQENRVNNNSKESQSNEIESRIDKLRKKILDLNNKLEEKN